MIHAREDYIFIQETQNPNTGLFTTSIKMDEPVMLFRARDALAPVILAKYADLLRLHNADPRMIQTVLAHEALMRKWQRINGCKMPDLPEEILAKVELG